MAYGGVVNDRDSVAVSSIQSFNQINIFSETNNIHVVITYKKHKISQI